MIQQIADALVQSWRNFASAFALFVPRLVAAIIIFGGGLVVALTARKLIHRLLVWFRLDRLSLRSGARARPASIWVCGSSPCLSDSCTTGTSACG